MALLSFEQIAAVEDVEEEIVPVPEWGGEVKVRGLTRREVKDITRLSTKTKGRNTSIDSSIFEKGIVFFGLVHPQIDENQYEVLLNKNAGGLQKVVDAIMRLSKMTDDEEEAENGLKREEGTFPQRLGSVSGISDSGDAGDDAPATDDGEAPTPE